MDIIVKGTKYIITDHALYRMKKRKVSADDIVDALTNVKTKRTQYKEGETPKRLIVGRNKVAMILDIKINVIITVYKFKPAYYSEKNKSKKNKERRQRIEQYGNRIRK